MLFLLFFQVLQKQMDLELELFGDLKEKTSGASVGKVIMLSLSSQPVDHETEDANGGRAKVSSERTKRPNAAVISGPLCVRRPFVCRRLSLASLKPLFARDAFVLPVA